MESPASAGLSRVFLVLALLLGGCAVGEGGDEKEQGGALPEELAEPARPLTVGTADATSTTAAGGPTPTGRAGTTTTTTASPRGGGAAGGTGTTTTTTTTAPGAAAPYTARAQVADRTGDAGLQAPPHGDLTSFRIEDDGTRARVTVRVAGTLPDPPAEGEVMGIGVDVFRGDDTESEYQLFALGNADGWRAGLQHESEWVEFPGTFELGADTIVFTVPWSSLGGRRPGTVSVFADWSKGRAAVLADASEDHAPNRGAQSFSF